MTEVSGLGAVKTVSIRTVKPAGNNPRKIPEQAIKVVAHSLERFGWQQPLVVDGDNVLIAGHTRLLAALSLGLSEVPVVVADHLTAAEVDAYRIADNRTHDFTSWDLPELVAQLDDLAEDFSDVLALADWKGIVEDFEDLTTADLPDDVRTNATVKGFNIVLVFSDEESALAAEAGLAEIPGVMDVRHARK
jgi:hypothetical protein